MIQSLTPHFSRKVMFLSFIFLLANLGIYALKSVSEQTIVLESLAPKLISATAEDIEIKSSYDENFRPAIKGQEIYSGTTIKTSEAEFAELSLGNNIIKLDESTELELVENNFVGNSAYVSKLPRLVFNLKSGSIWVNAFDSVEVHSSRSIANLHHAVGIMTYSEPINRVMVVTGDVSLGLLDDNGGLMSEFVVPLHNQVTFIDSQITSVYKALKPSKLTKELKMTPISKEVLEDEWVARNANNFVLTKEKFQDGFITSDITYSIRSGFQKAMEYLTFIPEARRNLALTQAKTMLGYILGALQDDNDILKSQEIIADFESLVDYRKNDPLIKGLIVKTLFAIEKASFGSPAYALKESLVDMVERDEGSYVYRAYLTDIRAMLFEGNVKKSESILNKWSDRWNDGRIENNFAEFDRQVQILNHTILSQIELMPISILEDFDNVGNKIISHSDDIEETRFEVTKNRLQIAASLVSHYKYILAKQYLKNSYLALNISEESQDSASTKIFLENGKLLAQRIQYAEDVLHGAAQQIDETQFRDYFQARTRDEGFAHDLQEFFDLEEEIIVASAIEVPTPAQVANRFLASRINVNYEDISIAEGAGFSYKVVNARLIDRGSDNETLSFEAIYDYQTNSVTEVIAEGRSYKGGFALSDIVLVLKKGDSLVADVYSPSIDESGIDLLITDEEKIVAIEGQLVAQDVARQLAFNELSAVGAFIPEVKFNIEILDELNLDKFKITNALIVRDDGGEPVIIDFDYNSQEKKAENIMSKEGVLLIKEVSLQKLAEETIAKMVELEQQILVIGDFNIFVKQNDLYIYEDDITYLEGGYLVLKDLEMLNLGLKVSGTFNPEEESFISVSHELLSKQEIDIKEYFEELAVLYTVSYLAEQGIVVGVDSIKADYPFNTIAVNSIDNSGYIFDINIDLIEERLLNVKQVGESDVIREMTFEEFLALPSELEPEIIEEIVEEEVLEGGIEILEEEV